MCCCWYNSELLMWTPCIPCMKQIHLWIFPSSYKNENVSNWKMKVTFISPFHSCTTLLYLGGGGQLWPYMSKVVIYPLLKAHFSFFQMKQYFNIEYTFSVWNNDGQCTSFNSVWWILRKFCKHRGVWQLIIWTRFFAV